MMDLANRAQKCHDYIRALEEEKKKIEMFQRDLPLCLQLVTQAIDNITQTLNGGDEIMAEAAPVLAEFLPLKPSLSSSDDDNGGDVKSPASRPDQKPDWLRSVQLWNQESDSPPKMELPKKPVAVNVKKIGGAFQPFEREKHGAPIAAAAAVAPPPAALPAVGAATSSSTTASTDGGSGSGSGYDDVMVKETKEQHKEKDGQSESQLITNRKARRCWSPELHRRFLQALQQLGGSHVATPKQIRELMKVDGLTNDEVKSHLQKYRLHTRRPNPVVQSNNNTSAAAPQFVVVGGIWVPPADYAVAAAQPTNPPTVQNEIYAPVALHPLTNVRSQQKHNQQNKKQQQRSPTGPLASDGRCSDDINSLRDDYATNSVSPTSSSSSQTSTASPPS